MRINIYIYIYMCLNMPNEFKPTPSPSNPETILNYSIITRYTPKELLRNAAKARIRRMIRVKKTRTDLAVPPFVKEEWDKGTASKDQLAELLQEVNWDKARYRGISCRK